MLDAWIDTHTICNLLKPIFHWKPQRKRNRHKQHEIYMPNANTRRKLYTILARVGSVEARVGSAEAHVGSRGVRVGFPRIFRYQHVGIPNAKCSRWGPKPKRRPNANGFAFQWNIGFRHKDFHGLTLVDVFYLNAFVHWQQVRLSNPWRRYQLCENG